jgi:hypothetical protein
MKSCSAFCLNDSLVLDDLIRVQRARKVAVRDFANVLASVEPVVVDFLEQLGHAGGCGPLLGRAGAGLRDDVPDALHGRRVPGERVQRVEQNLVPAAAVVVHRLVVGLVGAVRVASTRVEHIGQLADGRAVEASSQSAQAGVHGVEVAGDEPASHAAVVERLGQNVPSASRSAVRRPAS